MNGFKSLKAMRILTMMAANATPENLDEVKLEIKWALNANIIFDKGAEELTQIAEELARLSALAEETGKTDITPPRMSMLLIKMPDRKTSS